MTGTSETVDILVAGAGPAGLAAGLALSGLGYQVAIVSPARSGRDERTAALLGGSIDLLDRLGVWDALRPRTAPLRSLRIADGTRRLIRAPEVTFHAGEIGLEAFGYNVPNAALVEVLESAVAARGILFVTASVEGVVASDGLFDAMLSTGARLSACLAVAADGRRSVIRTALGIGTRDWRYPQSALVLNLQHALPHHDTSTEFHTEAGPFTLVPLPGNRSSLVWVARPEDCARRSELGDAALAAEIEERSDSILGAVAIDSPRQVFPLSGMTAERFAAGRAALVSEAAHVFPPIGAQGLNLGYRDVAAIAEVLTGRPADPGAPGILAAYERARRGDVLTRTAAVDALNRTLLTGFLPVQGVRGLGLFLLDRVPSLRKAVMRRGIAA